MTTALPQDKMEGLSRNHLMKLIQYGMIDLMKSKEKLTKEDYPEYKKYKKLSGVPIHISKAARKYDISDASLIRYVDRGLIEVIGKDKNRVLLNEQDVAYCVEILKDYGGKGKVAFREDGTPNY
mgnify:CR=1 FL=1